MQMSHFEITLDPNKEINPREQDNMINALQKAGIIDEARVLHQEIEKGKNKKDCKSWKKIQTSRKEDWIIKKNTSD